MSTVQEIEAAIPRLTRAQVEELREWIEDYLEDQLELTDEVKSKLDQSRREIAAGQFTTYDLPAYAEQAVLGANTFALGYAAKDVTASRSQCRARSHFVSAASNACA